MTPEGKVKQATTKVLKKYEPRVYYNMPVPNGYGESMLDYVGCANGTFFMIETKRPGKKRTDRQNQCAARVERAGGRVFTIDSIESPVLQALDVWLAAQLARGAVP
ncbi:hypothetical protein [Methylobacterium sp. 285MFTsu5.1]|uniref:hypothetical protein n=1 Tax=Methylobacterium sp. 285MFTsu5.1 TaxID=1172187 RepID=UPI000368CE85|nr:hypothetical protein [Methylobacterium sp. 285MFTsu5.1]